MNRLSDIFIKLQGKGKAVTEKAAEKVEDKPAEEAPAADAAPVVEEAPAAEVPKVEEPAPAVEEPISEKPIVPAATPVTAAA